MEAALLMDFGSTNTKVTAVDLSGARLLGTAAAYTTVETDIGQGLAAALTQLESQTGPLEYRLRLACSSAAGGLRMIAIGLTPQLTAQAARLASLGAGAKVIGTYAYQLTEEDLAQIAAQAPDIVLLTGGIDGGNVDCILHNANLLARCPAPFPIVVAGNRGAGGRVMELLAGREAYLCENVMPQLGELNILPAQQTIRELFLQRIIRAKGLSKAAELIDGILMPTPAAVLAATQLLARGTGKLPGLGELMAVDLGGATTDVYSMADGLPKGAATVYKGLPEPWAKRTVEGDIGMRYSAHGVIQAAGISRLAALAELEEEEARAMVDHLAAHPDALPQSPQWERLDGALATLAVETATLRHAGTLEQVYTVMGTAFAQTGKDLTGTDTLLFTGGAILHAGDPRAIAAGALYSAAAPQSLRPAKARVLVDKQYILAAMGLLAGQDPACALTVLKKELVDYGVAQSKA